MLKFSPLLKGLVLCTGLTLISLLAFHRTMAWREDGVRKPTHDQAQTVHVHERRTSESQGRNNQQMRLADLPGFADLPTERYLLTDPLQRPPLWFTYAQQDILYERHIIPTEYGEEHWVIFDRPSFHYPRLRAVEQWHRQEDGRHILWSREETVADHLLARHSQSAGGTDSRRGRGVD